MGGYIAAWLAATYPDRIASVALIDPAGVTAPTQRPGTAPGQGHNPFLINSREEFKYFYAHDHGLAAVGAALVLDAIAHRYQQHVTNWKKSSATFAPAHRWSRNWPGIMPGAAAVGTQGSLDRRQQRAGVEQGHRQSARRSVGWRRAHADGRTTGEYCALYREFLGNQR
jgi:pimeloyl-ACP methyl ester carboxylesterase